jgi:hypothetical protein
VQGTIASGAGGRDPELLWGRTVLYRQDLRLQQRVEYLAVQQLVADLTVELLAT